MKIYVNFELPEEARRLLEGFEVVGPGGDLSEVEAALVTRLTPEELAKMPRLRFIQVALAGLDHLPWEHIPPHVVVAGNAGSNADAVAEFALGMLLAAYKKIIQYNERMKRGEYDRVYAVPMLRGRKVAVLGLGEIGTRVAKILAALGAEVWGFSRSRREGPWRFTTSLEEALRGGLRRRVRPSTQQTHQGADTVRALGPDGGGRRLCQRGPRRGGRQGGGLAHFEGAAAVRLRKRRVVGEEQLCERRRVFRSSKRSGHSLGRRGLWE